MLWQENLCHSKQPSYPHLFNPETQANLISHNNQFYYENSLLQYIFYIFVNFNMIYFS